MKRDENEVAILCPGCRAGLRLPEDQDYSHWRQFTCGSLLLEDSGESVFGTPNVDHTKGCTITSLRNKLERQREASLAFLKEYQAYKADPNSVLFVPSKEVLKAFEEAVEGK